MIEEQRHCEDVITQLTAARAALDKVGLIAVQQYVHECIPGAPEMERTRLENALALMFKLPWPGEAENSGATGQGLPPRR